MLFADRLEVWNPGELPPSLTPESLRHPHASIPRNPLLAEPLFLTRHIEKAGTGILDMIGLCKAAKLRPPEFRQEMGQFIQTLWRPKAVTEGPVGAQSRAQSEAQSIAVIKATLVEPLSANDLIQALGMKSKTGALKRTLAELMADGFIEYTLPGKPNSRLQKYRLTEKGREALRQAKTEAGK
jgi:predicted HTH transcriptional regulator